MCYFQISAEIAALERRLESNKEELATLQASPGCGAMNGCGLEVVERGSVRGGSRESGGGGEGGVEQVGVASGRAEKEEVGKMSRAKKRKVIILVDS